MFDALLADQEYTTEEATGRYNAKCESKEDWVGSKTAYSYLKELSDQNLVTSARKEEERLDGSRYKSREFVYTKLSTIPLTTPLLKVGEFDEKRLDEAINELKTATLELLNNTELEVFNGLREKLLDAETPSLNPSATKQSTIEVEENAENDRDLSELNPEAQQMLKYLETHDPIDHHNNVVCLHKMITRGKVTLDQIKTECEDPSLLTTLELMVANNHVATAPDGFLFWK